MTFTTLTVFTTPPSNTAITDRRWWGFGGQETSAETASVVADRSVTAIDALQLALPGGLLLVTLAEVEDGMVATDVHSGIFGEGRSVDAALDDLVEHLRISLRGLLVRENHLSPDLRDNLERLRRLFGG